MPRNCKELEKEELQGCNVTGAFKNSWRSSEHSFRENKTCRKASLYCGRDRKEGQGRGDGRERRRKKKAEFRVGNGTRWHRIGDYGDGEVTRWPEAPGSGAEAPHSSLRPPRPRLCSSAAIYWACTMCFSSVQSLSRVRLFATPWTAARQASLSITNAQSLLKLMSIELVMPSNPLILCRRLLLLPSTFPNIRVFSSESFQCA